MRRSAEDTRRNLLAAASRLVARDGVASLTLEAVASEAGVSKGGLLYHFPGKQELVAAMCDEMVAQVKADTAAAYADEPAGAGRHARAYARAMFRGAREQAAATGLVAALVTDPALLAPVRADFDELQRLLVSDGIDPALATLVRLAADGLWYADIFGLAPPTGADRDAVLRLLLELTHEA